MKVKRKNITFKPRSSNDGEIIEYVTITIDGDFNIE